MTRNKSPPKEPTQDSLFAVFEQAAFEQRTAHLPSATSEAIPYYRAILERHHAAMLAGDGERAALVRKEAEDLAIRLNGGRFGYKADEDSPANVLERATAAPDGTVPLWGQAGNFLVELPAVRVRAEFDGIFGIGFPAFAAHVVDLDKPFISETGYRSFLSGHFTPVTGITVDVYARTIIEEHIQAELKGQLVPLEPQDRSPPALPFANE